MPRYPISCTAFLDGGLSSFSGRDASRTFSLRVRTRSLYAPAVPNGSSINPEGLWSVNRRYSSGLSR